MFADLHIHSIYSDGTMTIDEIFQRAEKNRVELLAVTDHNALEGTIQMLERAQGTDIRAVAGVELDALYEGVDFHILGLDIDPHNEALAALVAQNRAALDGMSDALLGAMQRDFAEISLEEYQRFDHDRAKGGWKALHYLKKLGITDTLQGGIKYYGDYGIHYKDAAFSSVAQACKAIRDAGGVAILAHPGETKGFPFGGDLAISVQTLMRQGVQGIECYYISHSEGLIRQLLEICAENGLYISAGCDCHGSFGNAGIGQNEIWPEQLNLPFIEED